MAVTNINIDSQVLTFANLAAFPVTGTVKTIYIAEDTNFQYYWDGSQYVLLTTDINIPANLTFYATTTPSAIVGYEKLVISIDDPDYDNPAVNVSTGAISGTAQLIAELASDAGIFAGNPGVITISTVGEIRRTAGSGGAEFYFEIYQRDSGGVETLRGTSNKTTTVTANVYQQFQASCLFNNGTWTATDRVVLKFYGDKIGGGSNPTYDFLFGGTNPVRTLFPISAQLLLNVPIAIGITGVTGGILDEVLLTDGSGKLGQSELKTVGGNSLFGSGDIPVGGGITIGTTAIASGTVGRVLFEGAGNVVQQSSNFFWDNTNGRLGIRVATPTASLEVLGAAPSGTTQSFAVHNSTGNNNALVVRDDGNVGIGTNAPANKFQVVGTNAASASGLEVDAAGVVYAGRTNSTTANYINLHVGGENGSFGRGGLRVGNSGGLAIYGNPSNLFPNIVIPNANFQLGFSTAFNNTFVNNNLRFTLSAAANSHTTTIQCNDNNSASLRLRSVNGSLLFGNATDNMVLTNVGNLLLGTTSEGASATKTLVINNGTAPTGNVTDSFQQYSADIVAGNAAPHFRTENGSIIKLYQETTGIAAAAFVANTSLILDDSATYGGYTMGQVVAALKAQGLLA
jgi:hypothetical protein